MTQRKRTVKAEAKEKVIFLKLFSFFFI